MLTRKVPSDRGAWGSRPGPSYNDKSSMFPLRQPDSSYELCTGPRLGVWGFSLPTDGHPLSLRGCRALEMRESICTCVAAAPRDPHLELPLNRCFVSGWPWLSLRPRRQLRWWKKPSGKGLSDMGWGEAPGKVRHRVRGGGVAGERSSWLKVGAERVSLLSESPRPRSPLCSACPCLAEPRIMKCA